MLSLDYKKMETGIHRWGSRIHRSLSGIHVWGSGIHASGSRILWSESGIRQCIGFLYIGRDIFCSVTESTQVGI